MKGCKWVWEEGYGWKTLLVGEVPDLDEEPRIVNRATLDYNMQMTQALFEMKNPSYNVWSRPFGDRDHICKLVIFIVWFRIALLVDTAGS